MLALKESLNLIMTMTSSKWLYVLLSKSNSRIFKEVLYNMGSKLYSFKYDFNGQIVFTDIPPKIIYFLKKKKILVLKVRQFMPWIFT